MRNAILVLAMIFSIPCMTYAQLDYSCDIGVYVLDDVTEDPIEDVEVYCYSYDEEVDSTLYTNSNGLVLFGLASWPNAGGCSNNYGDYMLCLPYFWEQEDVTFTYSGDCSQQSGCTVYFYIDEADEKIRWKCNISSE